MVIWLVFRFVRGRFQKQEPSESVEDLDPLTGVRAPRKRGPQSRSGAIALEEPDEDEGDQSFPPRLG